jgi:hypothetical protein
MPRPKKPAPPASTPELNIPKELLDQLVSGPMTQGDLETMFGLPPVLRTHGMATCV